MLGNAVPKHRIARRLTHVTAVQSLSYTEGNAFPGELVDPAGQSKDRLGRLVLFMRPGLTLLWVLAGRDTLDFDTWMKMNLQYIDSQSSELEWRIMLRTIPRVGIGSVAR